jgi:hypothetical protein
LQVFQFGVQNQFGVFSAEESDGKSTGGAIVEPVAARARQPNLDQVMDSDFCFFVFCARILPLRNVRENDFIENALTRERLITNATTQMRLPLLQHIVQDSAFLLAEILSQSLTLPLLAKNLGGFGGLGKRGC